LRSETKGSLYFPFELSEKRPPRATQFYLTKFPAAIVELFPALSDASRASAAVLSVVSKRRPPDQLVRDALGQEYRDVPEEAEASLRDPFVVDPAVVERGVRGHARTQNQLAAYVRELGHEPRAPKPHEPQFDLAWRGENRVFVAEVKSLTRLNEEQQLRLGLGQVLRYRQILGGEACAVLAAEREPTDSRWATLCDSLGVLLVWPENFDALAER
jgi:hypothetical protein